VFLFPGHDATEARCRNVVFSASRLSAITCCSHPHVSSITVPCGFLATQRTQRTQQKYAVNATTQLTQATQRLRSVPVAFTAFLDNDMI